MFRTQEKHYEVRTRIVYESVINIDKYLNSEYLQHGANHRYRRGTLAQQYVMYSDNYTAAGWINAKRIYIQEILDICKDGAFMGVRQILQVANVIGCPIQSVYPDGGNKSIKLNLNWTMCCINNAQNSGNVLKIMWTPMQVGNGRPCHFVPLLKVVRTYFRDYVYINYFWKVVKFILIIGQ